MSDATEIFRTFFENALPEMFKSITAAFPVNGMQGTVFTLQINLSGEGGAQYGITIKDAREMTVTPGGLDEAMLTVELPASIFINMVKNLVASPMQEAYHAAKETKGTVIFEPLAKGGKASYEIKLIMNKAEQPSIKLSAEANTFLGMMNGEESPINAFMQGRLKIDGDLPFGMELMNKFSAFMPSIT
jgi:putative sterol carrier protein